MVRWIKFHAANAGGLSLIQVRELDPIYHN